VHVPGDWGSPGVSAPNSKYHQTQLKILAQAWQQSALLTVVIDGAVEMLFCGEAAKPEGTAGKLNAKVAAQYAGTVVFAAPA
jgi:hypothetical protein